MKLSLVMVLLSLVFIAVAFTVMNKNDEQILNNTMLQTNMTNKSEINVRELTAKLQSNSDLFLLDVRTEEEYQQKSIPGSVLLPLQQLSAESLAEIGLNDKNKKIVVYCRSGVRSSRAQEIMRDLGYINVINMQGGIIEWENNDLDLSENQNLDYKQN